VGLSLLPALAFLPLELLFLEAMEQEEFQLFTPLTLEGCLLSFLKYLGDYLPSLLHF
jgi:hypothetical protein